MMKSPPRRKPPPRIESSPGTPVRRRSRIGCALSSAGIIVIPMQGQLHSKDRALSGGARDGDFAFHHTDELVCDPQAHSEPCLGTGSAQTMKVLENSRLIPLRDPDPLISDRE